MVNTKSPRNVQGKNRLSGKRFVLHKKQPAPAQSTFEAGMHYDGSIDAIQKGEKRIWAKK
jgi:hypothetical protein